MELRDILVGEVKNGTEQIELSRWLSRAALEYIGQGGLGYSFDSLAPDAVPHPYAASVKEFMSVSFPLLFPRYSHIPHCYRRVPHTHHPNHSPTMFRLFLPRVYILPHVYNLGPAWFRRAVVNLIPSPTMHALRDMTDVMWNTCNEIYSQKVAALQAGDAEAEKQVGGGKDILSLLSE